MDENKQLLSNFKFYSGNYSKYLEEQQRYETWNEAISDRVMGMHRKKYQDKLKDNPRLQKYFDIAEKGQTFGFPSRGQIASKFKLKIT